MKADNSDRGKDNSTKLLELKGEAYDLIVTQQKINLRLQQIGAELDKLASGM